MSDMPRADEVTNLTPEEVAEGLRAGRMLLVDVREPNETVLERYPGAVIVPLSAFDPDAIPDPQDRYYSTTVNVMAGSNATIGTATTFTGFKISDPLTIRFDVLDKYRPGT